MCCRCRLICLELTSSGNLQDFLTHLDVPLPEPCTRTILHDLAEGLASLHKQNILHRNLTSSAVYLKGSVQVSGLLLLGPRADLRWEV